MHMHYNQLISVQVLEDKNSGAVYSVDNDITFIFIAQKNESAMVKCKLHPRQKKSNKHSCIMIPTKLLFSSICTGSMLMVS